MVAGPVPLVALLWCVLAWAASDSPATLVAASSVAATDTCDEPSWCKTAPATKRQANGDENPKCGRWATDCRCTCPKALEELTTRETAERLAREAEEARIVARDAALRAHLQAAAAPSSSPPTGGVNNARPYAEVTISVLVRSQNVPSDAARVEHFRALGQQYAGVVEFLFLSDMDRWAEEDGVGSAGRGRGRRGSSLAPAGYWAITPFLRQWPHQSTLSGGAGGGVTGGAQWFVVVEPWTDVNVPALQALLGYFDSAEAHFLGRGLTMRRGVLTLQHEFGDLPFPFPDAGFALSRGLLDAVVPALDEVLGRQNFFVTWERELAHTVRKAAGVELTSLPAHFCDAHDPEYAAAAARNDNQCAVVARDKYALRASLGVAPEDVVIAVKTTVSYHAQRLDILRHTWARNTTHPVDIIFASDGPDPEYNTVDLVAEWGPQVDQKKGHCAKAYAIMQHLLKHYPHKRVFVIADDDTMMHVPNLLRMVDAYDWDQQLYLGQRYGYGFSSSRPTAGYAYVTMGGGVCLSKSFMEAIVNDDHITCSAADTPDDMQFGRWARRVHVSVTHDDGFHQAELENYNQDTVLRSQRVASYHKFKKVMDAATKQWVITTPANVDEYHRWFPDLPRPPPLPSTTTTKTSLSPAKAAAHEALAAVRARGHDEADL